MSHRTNLKLNDEASRQAVLDEMKAFKGNGGQTIVENTTTGLHRDLPFLKHVAEQTGVNMIAGAGESGSLKMASTVISRGRQDDRLMSKISTPK